MDVDRAYSVSDVSSLVPVFNYRLPFKRSQRTQVGRAFRQQILDELRMVGSPLTPEDVINRAQTLNCVGCHGEPGHIGGGLVFPDAFEQGEHIAADAVTGNVRLSPALRLFLWYRIDNLRRYLARYQE